MSSLICRSTNTRKCSSRSSSSLLFFLFTPGCIFLSQQIKPEYLVVLPASLFDLFGMLYLILGVTLICSSLDSEFNVDDSSLITTLFEFLISGDADDVDELVHPFSISFRSRLSLSCLALILLVTSSFIFYSCQTFCSWDIYQYWCRLVRGSCSLLACSSIFSKLFWTN